MQTSPILLIHIGGGLAGLLSGAAALSFRKGSQRHRVAGDVFVLSMVVMAVAAVYLAILKHQTGNVIGGVMTFYFVTTAWLTARRRDGGTGVFDWAALLFALTLAGFMLTNGLRLASSAAKAKDGVPVGMFFFIGAIALLSAAGDLRMLVRGITETQRLVRHLWRMCFALFIASGSFFLGPANRPLRLLRTIGLRQELFAAVFGKAGVLLLLAVLPLILMIFWMVRMRFTNPYVRRKQSPAPVKVIAAVVAPERTSPDLSIAK
ncbi:MAG TPA: DUF2306 domain-containing protein [Terriglobales bacterium]